MKSRFCSIFLAFSAVAFSQMVPGGAHVDLYFPQLADGGDRVQQWQTTFTFVNPNPTPADVELNIYDNDGYGMPMDLGTGLSSQHNFTIPAGGVRVLRSRMASPSITVGWAIADASVPVQATVAFRMFANGVAQQEVTAQPTLPTLSFTSFANRDLGIALGNAWTDLAVTVAVRLRDSNGNAVGERQLTVPALGHTSFVLSQYFPSLSSDFTGTVELASANPPLEDFVAWTLNADRGMISALPPGAAEWPVSHWERIRLVYRRILDTAKQLNVLKFEPSLKISYEPEINAFAMNGNTIQINVALSQLISDSQSELAFVIAHEMGHIIQMQTGDQSDDPTNYEFDADIKGTLLALFSGYDPYAGAGALAKLSMATGTAGLATQFGAQLAPDAHKSFNTRLDVVYQNLVKACNSSPAAKRFCDEYKSLVHPHLPPSAPLRTGRRSR